MSTLASLTPDERLAGTGSFLLSVEGANFVNGARVRWNGVDRPTTFNSSTSLGADIPATDLVNAGIASITVFNPAPGGGVSNALSFTITQLSNPQPMLTSLTPNSATAGGNAFTLAVNGANFVSGATVRWNGQNRTTNFGSTAQLTAQLTAADIASAGTASVTVFNPTPGGGASNALNFTINPVNPGGATVALTAGMAQTGALVAPPPNGLLFSPTQYTIEAPAGATQLRLDLSGNQNVDLYVRFGSRVEFQNNRFLAEYRSESATGEEQVLLSALSAPALRPGVYYIALGNYGPGAANFTLTARLETAADQAEREPNEAVATASLLPIAGQRTGNVADNDRAEISFIYQDGTRDPLEDFFKFELTRDTLIDLLLTTPSATADLDLFIFRDEGELKPVSISVGDIAATGQSFERLTVSLNAGRYLVGVSAYNGAAPYTLTARIVNTILVSSASYSRSSGLAPEGIVTVFGGNLAASIEVGGSVPLPTTLAGTTVNVRDSLGVERLAPLFYVAPTQINLQIPLGTAPGLAVVAVTNANGQSYTDLLTITNAAPSLFAANGDGAGVPAGLLVRVRGDGSQIFELIARFDQATNRYLPLPLDLGPNTDTVVLVLFGTGVRGRTALERV